MEPNLYVWLDEACKNLDKSEDIVFSSMDKETQLMVNILLYDIICMPYFCVLIWLLHYKNLLFVECLQATVHPRPILEASYFCREKNALLFISSLSLITQQRRGEMMFDYI